MKFVIRVDGGEKIGMGHVMRSLAIGSELKKNNQVVFVCKSDFPLSEKYLSGINKIKNEGFKVILINEKKVIESLSNIDADCLITDSYNVDENYFNETKKKFRTTGYIDDLNKYYFNTNFIINQNIYGEKYVYKCNKDTKLFLGIDYVILREEFRNIPPIMIKEKVKDILLTMGGADPVNFTLETLKYIKHLDFNIHVLIGNSFVNIEAIKAEIECCSNVRLYFDANVSDVMKKCDMAISSAGSTLYELCSLGIPTVSVIIAENQYQVAEELNRRCCVLNIGWFNYITGDDLVKVIERCSGKKMRRRLHQQCIENVKGDGLEMLCNRISDIVDNNK